MWNFPESHPSSRIEPKILEPWAGNDTVKLPHHCRLEKSCMVIQSDLSFLIWISLWLKSVIWIVQYEQMIQNTEIWESRGSGNIYQPQSLQVWGIYFTSVISCEFCFTPQMTLQKVLLMRCTIMLTWFICQTNIPLRNLTWADMLGWSWVKRQFFF